MSSVSPPLEIPTESATSTVTEEHHHQVELTDQTNLLPFKKVIAVFLGLGACVLVTALDSVIVATALPTISSIFNAGSVISWVPSAYLLTSTCFQPLYGRFSDIFGRKSAMTLAMTTFMVGNLIAGFSKSITEMIIARGIAGAGGGGIISMMQIIISDIVTLRDRGKYQGVIGSVVALGYAVGPVLGGVLVQKVGWQWCFWITIPISFVATLIVTFVLPLTPVGGNIRRKLLVVDYLGSLLTLAGCALIILPLIWGGVTFPWNSAIVLAPLFSGMAVVALFCLWEWKGARLPIVPMYIFKHQTVCGVYVAMFVNGFAFFSSLYYLPQYFQTVMGYSPIRAGVFLIPMLISQMVANWGSGIIISRTGRYRTIIYVGFAVWAIGCGCISTLKPESSKVALVIFMLLAGFGGGETLQTTTVAAQASVPKRDMSVVTAFRNFIRLLGGTLSLAIGSTLINNSLKVSMKHLNISADITSTVIDDPSVLSDPSSIGLSSENATYILTSGYTLGFRNLFLLNASLTVVAFIVSVALIKHKDLSRGEGDKMPENGKKKKIGDDVELGPIEGDETEENENENGHERT